MNVDPTFVVGVVRSSHRDHRLERVPSDPPFNLGVVVDDNV